MNFKELTVLLEMDGTESVIPIVEQAKLLADAGMDNSRLLDHIMGVVREHYPELALDALVAASALVPAWIPTDTPPPGSTTEDLARNTTAPLWWLNRFRPGWNAGMNGGDGSGGGGGGGGGDGDQTWTDADQLAKELAEQLAAEKAAREKAEADAKAASDALAAKLAQEAAAKAAADAAAKRAADEAAARRNSLVLPDIRASSSTWLGGRYTTRGEQVRRLQNVLTYLGYNVGSTGVDGIYGKNTTNAVRQFQSNSGIRVDGVSGIRTWEALKRAVG